MRNGVLSASYIMLTVTSFVGMEDFVTPEIFNWASNNPKIIDASSIAIRLMNDVTSHKRAVECYMREHAVSIEEACSELKKRVLLQGIMSGSCVFVLQRDNAYSISTWDNGE
ncbi:hypothetical protein Gotur_032316 [Gossypium turneri]